MQQHTIRRAWLVFILISNTAFLGYLYTYQEPAGILFGLPETWVVLFVMMLGVFATNCTFAWFYLDKPDIRQVFGASSGEGGDL